MAQNIVSMPQPGTRNAPCFKGKYPSDFIENFHAATKAAGIPDNDLPKLVLRYCVPNVRMVIKNDIAFSGVDWKAASERLIFLYDSGDAKVKAHPERLNKFVLKCAKKKVVKGSKTLDLYHHAFKKRVGDMLTTNRMTSKQVDLAFYHGLPVRLRKDIKSDLEDTVQGKLSDRNPPKLDETIKVVRAYFDEDDIDRGYASFSDSSDSDSDSEADDESSDSDDDSDDDEDDDDGLFKKKKKKSKGKDSDDEDAFGSESEDEKSKKKKKKNKNWSKNKKKNSKKNKQKKDKEVSKLTNELQRLQILVESLKNPPVLPPPVATSAAAFHQAQLARRCYMCDGVEGSTLTHPIGIRQCPETERLIKDGLIEFNKIGRLVKADGSDLPRAPPGCGGIAALLRSEEWANRVSKGKDREVPPHLASTSTARCSMTKLCVDGDYVLRNNRFAYFDEEDDDLVPIVSAPVQTRAQAKHQEEKTKGKGKEKATRIEEVNDSDMEASGSRGRPPVHPINTEKGWIEAQKEKRRDRAEARQEEQQQQNKGKVAVRYTSEIQDSVSINKIQDAILGTRVTLTLRDVIGMSSELQKRLSSITKTRREVRAEEGNAGVVEVDAVDVSDPKSSYTVQLTYDSSKDNLVDIIERYSSAIGFGTPKFYAMATGVVEGYFGATKVTFLVDSGSELNLISRTAYLNSNADLDEDGTKWSLKGVNGKVTRLMGCCKNAPIEISGKFFNHHFFVTPAEPGEAYDGILGQPWLQWFAARIDYERGSGDMDLTIWPGGKKDGPNIIVRLTGSRKPRAQPHLVPPKEPPQMQDF